jgi:cytochrome c
MARQYVRRALMVVLSSAGAIAIAHGITAAESSALNLNSATADNHGVIVLAQAAATAPAAAAAVAGNAAAGQQTFMLQCRVCHTVAKDGPPRRGPNLFGVVGRQAAGDPNYTYSEVFKQRATWKWEPAVIGGWITNPGALIPGTAMANFPGVTTADRDNVIAYLATLK